MQKENPWKWFTRKGLVTDYKAFAFANKIKFSFDLITNLKLSGRVDWAQKSSQKTITISKTSFKFVTFFLQQDDSHREFFWMSPKSQGT